MTKQQQPNLEQLVSARHEVPGSLPSVACAPLAFREALRLVILLTAQMPFSPNTQSSFSTNEVLSLGFLKTHHWGKTVANEVQIGSHWGGGGVRRVKGSLPDRLYRRNRERISPSPSLFLTLQGSL